MQSESTNKTPPVESYSHSGQEEHEIKRLEYPSCDMLGAEVVGGCYTSDCFRDINEVQAQVKNGAD